MTRSNLSFFTFFGLLAALAFSGCAARKAATSETPAAAQPAVDHSNHAPAPVEGAAKKPLSPHTSAMGDIGDAHVHIDYSSPGVRGRVIWGGLVPYGQVWATGAHQATWIEFTHDMHIGGQAVPKGRYGFFTIPGQQEWTLILNKNHSQHLADDYDAALDVVRVQVRPQAVEMTESLTYAVEPLGAKKGLITVTWEKIRVALPVEVR